MGWECTSLFPFEAYTAILSWESTSLFSSWGIHRYSELGIYFPSPLTHTYAAILNRYREKEVFAEEEESEPEPEPEREREPVGKKGKKKAAPAKGMA